MKTENQNCYETDEQNLFTRFETESAGDYLLPYSGLLFARMPLPGATDEILTLIYVTHTVTITGARLSALLETIQKGRCEIIRVGGQPNGNKTPYIHDIKITEGQQESGIQ